MVGEVAGDYYFLPGEILPHRRDVQWIGSIDKEHMSDQLRSFCSYTGTGCDITKFSSELYELIHDQDSKLFTTDPEIIDAKKFALESQLEEFIVSNWESTGLSHDYDIYVDDIGQIGKQYPTETGLLDILAISKDGKTFLVIELKKGRSDDSVVGQVQRYMGWVQEHKAINGEAVKGLIITSEDSTKIHYALKVVPNVSFMTYEVSFKLEQII